jgi:hypothetical protein
MKQAMIKILVVEPGKVPEVREIPNGLEASQKIVGGYIEIIRLHDDVILVCNEEGKLDGLPPNRMIPEYRDIIMGTFFLTYDDDEGNFTSLTDEQIANNIKRFSEHIIVQG